MMYSHNRLHVYRPVESVGVASCELIGMCFHDVLDSLKVFHITPCIYLPSTSFMHVAKHLKQIAEDEIGPVESIIIDFHLVSFGRSEDMRIQTP
jgi:hypothetical protein